MKNKANIGGDINNVAKLKQNRIDVATAIANMVAKNDAMADKFAVRGGSSGSLPVHTTITLGADVESDVGSTPRQVQLIVNYLNRLGGTATIADLNKLSESAPHGNLFWGKGSVAYEQTVGKVASHYLGKLLGEKEWDLKNLKGKSELISIVS